MSVLKKFGCHGYLIEMKINEMFNATESEI